MAKAPQVTKPNFAPQIQHDYKGGTTRLDWKARLAAHEQKERIFFYLHDRAQESQRRGDLAAFRWYRDGMGMLMREWRVWNLDGRARRLSVRHENET